MNYTHILCYALLKLSLKNIIDINDTVEGLLCSYFMKTPLFWLSEGIFINGFQLQNLFRSYMLCLDKLISWVKSCFCPNYVIPEHYICRGKINQSNSRLLLNALESIRNGEHGLFTLNAAFNSAAVLNQSFVNLEMFWYRVIDISIDFDIETRYTVLRFI